MNDTGRTRAERALAAVVAEIRTDWQEPGIVVALRKVSERPLADVTAAALYCATKRTDQRTPDCIWRDGEHWQALGRLTGQTATTAPDPRCSRHGQTLPCLRCQADERGQIADLDTIRRIRAEARNHTEGDPA